VLLAVVAVEEVGHSTARERRGGACRGRSTGGGEGGSDHGVGEGVDGELGNVPL